MHMMTMIHAFLRFLSSESLLILCLRGILVLCLHKHPPKLLFFCWKKDINKRRQAALTLMLVASVSCSFTE